MILSLRQQITPSVKNKLLKNKAFTEMDPFWYGFEGVIAKVDNNNSIINGTTGTYAGLFSATTGYNTINIGINSDSPMNLDVEFTNQGPTGPTDPNLTYKDSIFANTNYNNIVFNAYGAEIT